MPSGKHIGSKRVKRSLHQLRFKCIGGLPGITLIVEGVLIRGLE